MSKTTSIATFIAALFCVPLLFSAPAQAETIYPYCYNSGFSTIECNFETMAQCLANIPGRGGTCSENPRFQEMLKDTKRKKVIVR